MLSSALTSAEAKFKSRIPTIAENYFCALTSTIEDSIFESYLYAIIKYRYAENMPHFPFEKFCRQLGETHFKTPLFLRRTSIRTFLSAAERRGGGSNHSGSPSFPQPPSVAFTADCRDDLLESPSYTWAAILKLHKKH